MTTDTVHDLSDAELMREIAQRLGWRECCVTPRMDHSQPVMFDLPGRRTSCPVAFLAHAIAAMAERGLRMVVCPCWAQSYSEVAVVRADGLHVGLATYDPTSVASTTTAGLRAVCDALRMEEQA